MVMAVRAVRPGLVAGVVLVLTGLRVLMGSTRVSRALTAVAAAVVQGARSFSAIAVATSGVHPPCGACRQVLAEFCEDLIVLLVDPDEPRRVVRTSLDHLLPERFRWS